MAAVALKLDMPIRSVTLLKEGANEEIRAEQISKEIKLQQQQIRSLCESLQQVITATEQAHQNLFVSQKEKIVRLSVDIASKILAKNIREGNYEIENIIIEAIQTIPVSGQTLVRLNPADLETLRQAAKNNVLEIPEKIQFVDDSRVGRAECIVESDQGVVEYLIEEHLKQIETALKETQSPSEITQP